MSEEKNFQNSGAALIRKHMEIVKEKDDTIATLNRALDILASQISDPKARDKAVTQASVELLDSDI